MVWRCLRFVPFFTPFIFPSLVSRKSALETRRTRRILRETGRKSTPEIAKLFSPSTGLFARFKSFLQLLPNFRPISQQFCKSSAFNCGYLTFIYVLCTDRCKMHALRSETRDTLCLRPIMEWKLLSQKVIQCGAFQLENSWKTRGKLKVFRGKLKEFSYSYAGCTAVWSGVEIQNELHLLHSLVKINDSRDLSGSAPPSHHKSWTTWWLLLTARFLASTIS